MDLFAIITYALVFTAGAFLGVLLGRRSKSANATVDRIQAEADRLRDRLRQYENTGD
jgi:LPS O-antigen subunit length determinant protein (WzzB/FepE family)